MSPPQLDLFATPQTSREEVAPPGLEPPADFIARIRAELHATLHCAREARSLPWPDLTRATLAELRFNSICRWLPESEAASLRAAFEAEMTRLYELEDAAATES